MDAVRNDGKEPLRHAARLLRASPNVMSGVVYHYTSIPDRNDMPKPHSLDSLDHMYASTTASIASHHTY